MIYKASTEYWDPAKPHDRAPDALWDALNTRPVAVAIDQTWAKQHNLPITDPWPWDDEKGLYYIKAFHNLHCVKIIRQAYHYALRGEEFTIASHHIDHCFDALRQDIMCRADDTPMPVNATEHSIGNGQELRCRDWNKLVEWTQHPDRQACYDNLGDYEDIRPSLELFAFCPKDYKYYDIMSRYFAKFGHKELWVSTD
ncbi:MAG: hypothetical protein M1821_005787 [Bathelium mastoideum]|nr:MAG: hypothetical protein M1821_005787 [Bathelium mastoideum]